MKFNGMMVVAGLALAGVSSGALGQVMWSNHTGSNTVLSWEQGQSVNGYFGSPTVNADTFFFIANENFDAVSDNGVPVTKTDTLSVIVRAQPGRVFTEVIFASQGDYQVFGSGASANVSGSMSIQDLNSPRNQSDSFHTSISPSSGSATAFPVMGNDEEFETGSWNGFSLINFAAFGLPPVTEIQLTYTNTIVAISVGEGTTASILTLPNTQGSFSLQIVPAPATAMAGLMGLGLLGSRRRRA